MDRVKAWLNHRSGKYSPSRAWHLAVWGNVALCTVLVAGFAWQAEVLPASPGSTALSIVCASFIGLSAGFTAAHAVNHRRWLRMKETIDLIERSLRGDSLIREGQPGSRRYRKALNED
jgi:peptidoglycan biosynthesis protein MviN/MurJ (putative lipid II flippase)